MIRLKKLPGDKWNLPKTKSEMQARWAKIKARRTPHASPCNSDNEESDAEDDDSIVSQAEPADEGFWSIPTTRARPVTMPRTMPRTMAI